MCTLPGKVVNHYICSKQVFKPCSEESHEYCFCSHEVIKCQGMTVFDGDAET